MRGLNKAESAALRQVALSHGFTASRGPTAKDGAEAGNPILLLLAIISGEVATVLLEEDQRWYAIRKLEASGDEVLIELAANLRAAAEREQQNEAATQAEYSDPAGRPI